MIRLPLRIACAAALAAAALAAPHPVRADDTSTFIADTKRFAQMKSFRMQLDSVSPTAGSTSELLTYVAPDRLRVDMPSKNFTAVVIGSDAWLRGRSGHWKKVKMAPGADPLAAVHDTAIIAERIRGRAVRFVGTQRLGGDPMHVYEIDAPPRAGYSAKTERVWIGANDGFPHRIEQHNGAYASTAVYSSFNQPMSVSVAQ